MNSNFVNLLMYFSERRCKMNLSFFKLSKMGISFKYVIISFLFFFFSKEITAQNPRVFINEFLSSNLTTNPDMVDFGDFSDWIELYNDENSDVNIGGFYLTDDLSQPMKWQIPLNTIIPAKGYYLIWADGYNDVPGKTYTRPWWPDNTQFTTQRCHTNFKLDRGGDEIGLFDSGSNRIDSVLFSEQITDVSLGRKPDGSNNWFYFGEPTPLKSNTSNGISSTNISGSVNFSIEGGFYLSSVQATLSSNSGSGVIRYTTDGSEPTSSSNQYSTPLNISSNTILRARVFENSKLPGKIITNSYFIGEPRNLPAISLVTQPPFLWGQSGIYRNSFKDREIPVSLEYFSLNSGRAFFLDAGARIGGENIYRFAEKPLNIYTRSDYGYSNLSYKIFDDLPYQEFKRLYLRNSGDDWPSTMLKDGMLVNILKGQISNSMQAFKPSVLYLNGQYWGIYNLREKIDDQYFLLHYNVDPSDLDHLEDDYSVISGDSSDFVNLLSIVQGINLSDSMNYAYVASKVDIHNLMDFVIVQDYLANSSWGHNREIWQDKKNEKLWRWILVDMDRGFNSSRISTNQIDDIYNNFELFRALCSNESFKNEFVQRYSEHINHTFEYNRVTGTIDSLKSLIENEMPRHIQKWGTYIDSLTIDIWGQTPGITSLTSWNTEIQNLKNFSAQRSQYAIQHLNNRFNLSGRANLKISTNVQNKGKVVINGFFENLGENILYFKDAALPIQIYPPPGYGFKQWKEIVLATDLNLIPAGSEWKYRDESSAPDNTWKNVGYNDGGWKSGNSQFGYGDGDENTVISYGSDSQNKYITSYYRRSFQITNPSDVNELKLRLMRDDGAVVYLNGTEILRSNMPAGTVTYSTLATTAVGGDEESTFFEFTFDNTNLVTGENVLAVEMHQSSGTSSDISFDLSLDATLSQPSVVENIISSRQSISYTLTGDTELIAEFEEVSSGSVPLVINGAVTLSKGSSPYYYVQDDVTVGTTGVLTIEPGVIIYFSSGKGINVQGKLLMQGTNDEPITLTSYYPSEKWGAISFNNSVGTSELSFVNISNATSGIDTINFFAAVSSYYSAVQLSNVHFDHVKFPVSSQWSDMTINSCTFENVTNVGDYINCNGGNLTVLNSLFKGNNLPDMDALDIGFINGTTRLKNNIIKDFTGSNSDGIDLGDGSVNVEIENNLIVNCGDKGVSIGQGSSATLLRNSIAGCNLGVGVKDNLSYANILNCTFYSNNTGVSCFEKNENEGGGTAEVKNSIFANSNESPFKVDNVSTIAIDYSLSNTVMLPGQENILDEPLMINPEDLNFHLQTGSPCIDKGDPQAPNDNDGTRSDIGAFMYAGVSAPVVVINEINYNSANDFDSEDWVELYNNTNGTIDLSGWVFMDENRAPSYAINQGTVLLPNSYLVLCLDLTLFQSRYPAVPNILGNLNSGLGGGGESLFLYDNSGKLVDSLTYDDHTPWPTEADGNGSSLELDNPSHDNSLGINWRASVGHGTPGAINSTYVVGTGYTNKPVPTEFLLQQNYPNPFNPYTNIKFEIPEQSSVKLIIYNVLGKEIAEIADGEFSAGTYSFKWDAGSFSSGIYFLQMDAQSKTVNKKYNSVIKLILVK